MNCNVNHNHNSTKWYHHISMELYIEFIINFLYFINWYNLFIFELSSSNILQALLLIFLHLLSESCHDQSIIRFSKFYFDQTNNIYSRIHNYYYNDIHSNNYNNCLNQSCFSKVYNEMILVLMNRFEDDSNLHELRIRHSIDSSIRCICVICSFAVFRIQLILLPHHIFNVSSKSDFFNGVFCLFLSFSCDLIYFFCIFLFNYYTNHYF